MKNATCEREQLLETAQYLCSLGSRVTGSPAEADAAAFVEREFRNIGLNDLHHFRQPADYFEAKKASVEFLHDGAEIAGIPCWGSKETPRDGVIAKSIYIGGAAQVADHKSSEIEGKIVFVLMDKHLQEESRKAWKELFAMRPAGIVFLDRERERAPRTFLFEPLHELFFSIPCMVVLANAFVDSFDAMNGEDVRLTIEGRIHEGEMHIIACEKKGDTRDTVLVCAHHDSLYMTEGATDNAAGVAIMLEIARALSQMDTKYTYRFISFGGEEQNMNGSRWYVEHQDISDVTLCFNVDSIGNLPGIVLLLAAADDSTIDILSKIAKDNPYPAQSRRVSTSGGDNIIFAARTIPTIHLAMLGTVSGKVSHSSADVISLLSGAEMEEAGNLALRLFERIEREDIVPAEISIPEDLVDAAKERIDIS